MKTNFIRNSIVAIAAAFAIGTAWAGPGYGPGTGPRAGTADCPVAQANQGPLHQMRGKQAFAGEQQGKHLRGRWNNEARPCGGDPANCPRLNAS